MEVIRKDIPIVAPEFRIARKSGTVVPFPGNQVAQMAMATFDPSANSGERTVGAHGLGVYIPAKAIVTRVWYDVITTFASAGADAGTIALHLQSANDILAAIAISDASNVLDAGIRGTKIGAIAISGDAETALVAAAAQAANLLKMTAEREITATVGGQALTAGKMNVFVEYVLSA